jgi:hypothetical protein
MSEVPPYADARISNVRAKLSAASITSFILGLFFCIPLITSLLALLFAVVGLRATRADNPAGPRGGRGFAITGLVLGILGLVLWAGVGVMTAYIISASAAPRALVHTFAADLAANNKPAALAISTPAIDADGFDKTHAYIVPFGAYRDLTCTGAYLGNFNGSESCRLSGHADFATGSHPFSAVVINDGGTWKIAGFHIW